MTHTPTPKLPRWLRLTLFASLALNLAVIGAVISLAVSLGREPERPARLELAAGAYTRALTREDRRAVFEGIRRDPANAPSRRDARNSFGNVLNALRSEPFVEEELRAAMLAQQELFARRANRGQNALVEHLIAMSDAERAAYADRLEEALRHRRNLGHDRPAQNR